MSSLFSLKGLSAYTLVCLWLITYRFKHIISRVQRLWVQALLNSRLACSFMVLVSITRVLPNTRIEVVIMDRFIPLNEEVLLGTLQLLPSKLHHQGERAPSVIYSTTKLLINQHNTPKHTQNEEGSKASVQDVICHQKTAQSTCPTNGETVLHLHLFIKQVLLSKATKRQSDRAIYFS